MRKRCYIAVVMILLFGYTLLLAGCPPERLVSTSQEIDIGREASRDVENRYRLVTDPELNAMVNTIGQTLAGCSDRPNLKYTFKILDIKEVNAFSLPGGWIYVNRGLIDATRGRRDELAGVIAHEIGHVAARHHAEMIGRDLYAQILVGTLTRGQVQQIASVFANLAQLSWRRQQEFDADKLGIKEMWRCRQYNPQGLVDFFGTLLKMEKDKPSGFEQIFRTHPVTSDRIKRSQTYLNDLRAGRQKA